MLRSSKRVSSAKPLNSFSVQLGCMLVVDCGDVYSVSEAPPAVRNASTRRGERGSQRSVAELSRSSRRDAPLSTPRVRVVDAITAQFLAAVLRCVMLRAPFATSKVTPRSCTSLSPSSHPSRTQRPQSPSCTIPQPVWDSSTRLRTMASTTRMPLLDVPERL
mgnify:FL=1